MMQEISKAEAERAHVARPETPLPYSTPLRNRLGAPFGSFCRLRRETSTSQKWLKGQNMAAIVNASASRYAAEHVCRFIFVTHVFAVLFGCRDGRGACHDMLPMP